MGSVYMNTIHTAVCIWGLTQSLPRNRHDPSDVDTAQLD